VSERSGGIEAIRSVSRRLSLRSALALPVLLGMVACQVYDSSLLPDFADDPSSDGAPIDDTSTELPSNACEGSRCVDAFGSGRDAGPAEVGTRDGTADVASDSVGERGADATSAIDAGVSFDGADARCQVGSPGCIVDAAADAAAAIDVDNCPGDPIKTQPGRCGCGTPDTDTDGDGTPDCIDGCPSDARKTTVGLCGCGKQDPPDGGGGAAYCFKDAMIHRYAFNGTGAVASDTIGTANGTVQGGSNARQSGGAVSLSGDMNSAGYAGEGFVALPSNLLSGLTSATFEAWVTWDGAGRAGTTVWQRIFDFGDQTGNGTGAVGRTYLFVTASAAQTGGALRATYSSNGTANETFINASTGALPTGARKHVALVVDDPNNTMSLYLDGAIVGFVQLTGTLASVADTNSWLGRSQFAVDPELNGSLHEFRIYNLALSAAQVQASFAAGPDPSYLP
jgi:hypothetical protein